MQAFLRLFECWFHRLKIVVSPVRVRVSPSAKPYAAWIFLFPERLPYRTRIGTRDGRCSHVRVRVARRARESGERPSRFPVMSSGRSSPVRSASAASGAPLLRFKDPAAMAYTIMRRRTPGPRPERASVDVQWSRSRRRAKRKRDSGLRPVQAGRTRTRQADYDPDASPLYRAKTRAGGPKRDRNAHAHSVIGSVRLGWSSK